MNRIVYLLIALSFVIGVTIGSSSNVIAQQTSIPSWVKNTALWWGQGQVSDADFIKALQWLIDNNILKIPTHNPQQSNSNQTSIQSQSQSTQTSTSTNPVEKFLPEVNSTEWTVVNVKQCEPSDRSSAFYNVTCSNNWISETIQSSIGNSITTSIITISQEDSQVDAEQTLNASKLSGFGVQTYDVTGINAQCQGYSYEDTSLGPPVDTIKIICVKENIIFNIISKGNPYLNKYIEPYIINLANNIANNIA